MDVHIINMKHAVHKWTRCSSRFTTHGFQVYRQEGCDVRHADLSAFFVGNNERNVGMLGCALSHRTLWQRLLNSEADFIIIAEDDAIPLAPMSDFRKILRSCISNVDIVHFGCGTRCSPSKPFIGLHCYCITKEGARKYFDYWKNNISVPIDKAIGMTPGLVMYHTPIQLATFEKLKACTSDIANVSAPNYPVATLLDQIWVDENKTLGYVMFYPKSDGSTLWDRFILAVLLIALIVKKYH
jgi:GR25 family glycosyltransferase involved in LPS biosynthesis